MLYPDTNDYNLKSVAEIAAHTRDQIKGEAGKLTTAVSTRISVEMAGLLYDGFSLLEAAEVAIFPFYSQDGGMDSERTYIKQLIQKFVVDENEGEKLFNEVKEDDANDDTIVW